MDMRHSSMVYKCEYMWKQVEEDSFQMGKHTTCSGRAKNKLL